MSIQETIQRMKDAWSVPRRQTRSDAAEPDFMLSCTFADEPARSDELAVLQGSVPEDLMAFWRLTRTASLFVDRHYGQWGLEILSPSEAVRETHLQRRNRPAQYRDGDVVIGRFLGDSNLLASDVTRKVLILGRFSLHSLSIQDLIGLRPQIPLEIFCGSIWKMKGRNFGRVSNSCLVCPPGFPINHPCRGSNQPGSTLLAP